MDHKSFAERYPVPTRSEGVKITIVNSAQQDTDFALDKSLGQVVGLSIAPRFSDAVLSQIYLSVTKGNNRHVLPTTLDNFLVKDWRPYYPITILTDGIISFTFEDVSGTGAVVDERILTLHYIDDPDKV